MSSTYEVRAVRWSGGWELHIDGEGVTQCRTLDQAVQQVRDYLETVHDTDFGDAEIRVVPELGGIEKQVRDAQATAAAAASMARESAKEMRVITGQLRDKGLSVSDIAAVLGVSRGRVSQLVKGTGAVVEVRNVGSKSTGGPAVEGARAVPRPRATTPRAAAGTTRRRTGASAQQAD